MKKNELSEISYTENSKSYLSKLADAQIPIKNDSFKKKVRNFRKKWKIPIHGFRIKRLTQKWLEKPKEELLKRAESFKITEEEIIYSSGKRDYSLEREITSVKNFRGNRAIRRFPHEAFWLALKYFMTENSIDEALIPTLYHYILYNTVRGAPLPIKIVEVSELISRKSDGAVINRQVCLKFGPNVRQKDVNAIFSSQVLPIQKTLPGYQNQKMRTRNSL